MSFPSDTAAIEALCTSIFAAGNSIIVRSEGDRLCDLTRSTPAVIAAVLSVSDDCVLIAVDPTGRRVGWFRVLAQDDPDCLIVDYGVNTFTEAVWAQWSSAGEVL